MLRKLKLTWLIISAFAIVVVITLSVAWFSWSALRLGVNDEVSQRQAEKTFVIASVVNQSLASSDYSEVISIATRFFANSDIAFLQIENRYGDLVATFGQSSKPQNSQILQELRDHFSGQPLGQIRIEFVSSRLEDVIHENVRRIGWAYLIGQMLTWLTLALIAKAFHQFTSSLRRGFSILTEEGNAFPSSQIAEFNEVFESLKFTGKSLKEYRSRETEFVTNLAIARTTQMLAHDVRKPFSILKMGLELLNRVKSISELTRVLGEIAPEVDRAMTSVNGMINDVMEIGRTSAPQQEPVSVESLIEVSLNEVGRVYNNSDISFSYELKHAHMLFVDPLKVGRVFSNILGNAMQAIKGKGRIWVRTAEVEGMITFCLGNEGSFIAADNLPRLFEAFFTKDKKGGTGLGLAIAQKAVHAHGGKIWCESSAENKTVEFFFTLPICQGMASQSTAQLPESSKAILEHYQKSLSQITGNSSINESASTNISSEQLGQKIISYSKDKGMPLTVAIIDDEAIYRNALMGLVDGADGLKEVITVDMFSNSKQLLDAFASKSYDFLICDIDLGRDSLNGYEIVKILRTQGNKTAICIHSNRALPEDYAHSVEVGAQAFLPKPLSRFHLLKFMSGIIDGKIRPSNNEILMNSEGATVTSDKHLDHGGNSGKIDTRDHIIYVDDEKVYRTYAPSTISDARVSTYQTPEEVIAEIAKNQNFLSGLSAIITDQYFGKLSATTGLEFAAILRKKYGFKNPIILNSNEEFTFEDLKGNVDLCLPKKLKTWAEIKKSLPISPDDAKEPPFIIERKPHSELTEVERAGFSKLRHNVRGALGGIELIIVNMKPNETREDFSEKCDAIAEYFSQLTSYFSGELIAEFSSLFEKLKSSFRNNNENFSPVFNELKAALEKLKLAHYNDDWWRFDPQEEAKKEELAKRRAMIERPTHEVVINMANKELQQRIMTYAAEELGTKIVVTKDEDSLAPIVITDSFDICGAALNLESDVLMVEDDAVFEMIIKKLKFKLEIRSRKKNGPQNNG